MTLPMLSDDDGPPQAPRHALVRLRGFSVVRTGSHMIQGDGTRVMLTWRQRLTGAVAAGLHDRVHTGPFAGLALPATRAWTQSDRAAKPRDLNP